jgi:hypothetical protein
MKFKTIFILFNFILIFSFSFIFLMPFFLLGGEYTLAFWMKNWPLFLFFSAVLAGFNVFFALNWRLFTLLESEDWNALGILLSARVFNKKRYDRRTMRLLVNTSLLRGDMDTVSRLEKTLRDKKPLALRRDAVLFGAARLLRNDAEASETFMAEFSDGKGVENPAWIGFYHAFSMILRGQAAQAAPKLRTYLDSKDSILAALAAYLSATLCAPKLEPSERQSLISDSESRRSALVSRYPGVKWSREVERAKTEIHIVILSKILDEASTWLFPPVQA